ncbi:MAG: hypothetical protein M9962_02205 [Oligoflexia bacterium]|nr:hypothetical protein [Oligoflexia bacterium]
MADLKINGENLQKSGSTLFADFIRSLNKELAMKSEVVSILKVNGSVLDEDQETLIGMKSLDQIGRIEITTIDQTELAFEALSSAKAYIKKLILYCEKNGERYKLGMVNDADQDFIHLVDGLENLTQLILASLSILKVKYKGIHTNDSSLRIAQVRLVSAIEELLPAKRENDYIMLADILCNELPDALREMADYGIPMLQRLKCS